MSGNMHTVEEHDACGVGFVARLDAVPSHAVVEDAITALSRLAHRGGSGCGPENADGAGLLLPLPRAFMQRVWQTFCPVLPEHYGVGHFFLPRDENQRGQVETLTERIFAEHGLKTMGWRDTPSRDELLQEKARLVRPVIRQLLVTPQGAAGPGAEDAAGPGAKDAESFERVLYLARRHLERAVREELLRPPSEFHVASLSSHSIVYKGMLPGGKLAAFYPDLASRDFTAHFAIFHERFSTNTQPAWRLAQPFRCLAHNGEINTLHCNKAAMAAREPLLHSPLFGEYNQYVTPVLEQSGSDSAMLDNALELLLQGGRSLPHAAMMLVPEAFGRDFIMGEDKRAFYEYHAAFMEPWDGPSALVFTDGCRRIGAMLDRNALRPCRYVITRDGLFLLASEAGVLDLPENRIARRGRLQPRRMLLVDFARRRVVTDAECKGRVIYAKPYRHWVREKSITLRDLPLPAAAQSLSSESIGQPPAQPTGQSTGQPPGQPTAANELLRQQHLYGFSKEDLTDILIPMGQNAQEPIASMGQDTPLAILSQEPQLLFSYLKQRFAQVTNPPIDPLREGLVMSLTGFAGRRGNLLEETPEHYSLLRLANPLLFPEDINRLAAAQNPHVRMATIPMLFPVPAPGAHGNKRSKQTGPAPGKNSAPDATQNAGGGEALEQALAVMCAKADAALSGHNGSGATLILLSDAAADAGHAPIPSLLAVSALHHHLLRNKRRHACGILVDTGEAREVMHLAQLIAFGASAVHPRLAFATLDALALSGELGPGNTALKARNAYATAIQKGLLKTFSRMGISTLRSFMGGQGFEALGFGEELVERYFTGLPSRIGGIGLEEIATDALARHCMAYPGMAYPADKTANARLKRIAEQCGHTSDRQPETTNAVLPRSPAGALPGPPELPELAELADLEDKGRHRHRNNGEKHLWSPAAIRALHKAVRDNDPESYRIYADESDRQTQRPVTLRGLLRFAESSITPVPLDAVEPESAILRRFVGAAMSLGSISPEAHAAIAVAFNRAGGRSNCGEGGEAPERLLPLPGNDSARSRVRQIASGRFGVTATYLVQADEIQIKMAQGAKPGEGGQLPAHKVLPEIARVRHTIPGVTLISPPPHHDIYSIEDLAQLIYDLKRLHPAARISVKLVAGTQLGPIACGVAKAGADSILISGHDGGTGASPRSAIAHVGLPWELGLAETQAVLVNNGLRERVLLQTDGQLRTGKDLAVAALLGADEFGFGASLLVALGCCMLRVCHLGTCSVGIATQDLKLRAKFQGKAEHVERFLRFLAADLRGHMAKLGFRTVDEMIGRADLLEPIPLPPPASSVEECAAAGRVSAGRAKFQPRKLVALDLRPLLIRTRKDSALKLSDAADKTVPNRINIPDKPEGKIESRTIASPPPQSDRGNALPESPLDAAMLAAVMPGVRAAVPSRFEGLAHNTDRAVCAALSGEIARLYPDAGLPPGSVEITLRGSVGQSAGAFLMRGITLNIKGEANDYVGKGLSGGIIAVSPTDGAPDKEARSGLADEQAVIGNVALYGATSGEAYFAGTAGERFAVRNSGAQAVVEGVGDHACEYMTGGVVVVLGSTGYNFAAGMSGGVAYVFDRSEHFQTRCNMDGVDLESVWRQRDVLLLRSLLTRHVRHTGSPLAASVLEDWNASLPLFLKVTPIEYQRALARMKQNEGARAESIAATEEVYHP